MSDHLGPAPGGTNSTSVPDSGDHEPSAGSSVASASLVPTAVKTANYAAAASDYVPVDTTSGSVTITLPTAPADKAQVGIKHVVRGGTNVVTIACGGSDVLNKTGGSTSGTITLLNQSTVVQYKASSGIWYVVGGDLPLSQLDTRYPLSANNLSDLASAPAARLNLGVNRRGLYVPDGWGSYWKAGRATSGSALVPVAVVGDSLTNGQSASTEGKSWVGLLKAALQTGYGDGGSGFVNVDRAVARGGFTFGGSGWVQNFSATVAQGPGDTDGAYSTVSGATATVTGRGTTVEFYYLTSGDGTLTGAGTVAIDGGTAVAISANRADGTSIKKVSRYRVTGLTAGSHTLVFTTTNTASLKIFGARFTNATGIVVDNHGASGRRSGAASRVGTPTDPNPAIWAGGYQMPAYLGIWAYGVNDVAAAYGTTTSVRDYILNAQGWAQAVMASAHGRADLLFIAPHVGTWENVTNGQSTYAELILALRGLAEEYGAAMVNLWALGENSWDWMNDLGYWSDGGTSSGVVGTDGVHLSDTGHQWWYDQISPVVLDTSAAATVPATTPKVRAFLTQTATSGVAPKTVVFDASTSYAGFPRSIASYTFDPGDGTGTVTQASPTWSHSYTTQGTYTPTVTVTDSAAATGTATGTPITVSPVLHLQDLFTDTDGVLLTAHTPDQGSAWTTHGIGGAAWNFGINGNQLALLTAGSGTAMVAVNDPGVHDTVITIVHGALSPTPWVWYVDDSNYVEIAGNALNKVVAGSTTQVTFWGGGNPVAGDITVVTLSGTSVSVSRNGSSKGSGTVSDSAFTAATKVALRAGYPGSSTPYKLIDSIQVT